MGRRREDAELDDRPAPDEEMAHEALLQWAAWAASGGVGRPGKCASVESRYVPPLLSVHNPPSPGLAVDSALAERVNAALLRVPPDYAECLRQRYHRKLPARAIARVCGIPARAYPAYVRAARLALQEQLA